MEGLDAIFTEYARLRGSIGTASSQPRSPEEILQQQRLKARIVDWAARQSSNRPPHSIPPQARPVENSAIDINQKPISLGFFGDDLEFFCSSYLEDELREIEMHDHEVNADASENKQLADLLEWKQESIEFVEAAIPLPEQSSERHDEVLEKIRHRVPVSSQKLPSSIMYTLLNSQNNISTMSMIHDGQKMAVGFTDSSISVYDLTTTAPSRSEIRHKRHRFEEMIGEGLLINGDLFDKDVADCDNEHESREATKAYPFPSVSYHGHTNTVTAISCSNSERILLSSSTDGTIRLWSESLKCNICVYKGHLYPVLDVDACPAGYYFLSGSMDQTARLWCTERMSPIRIYYGHGTSVDLVKWHPGCSYFGSAGSDGQFRLWDIKTAKPARLFKSHPSASGTRAMTCFRFGSDGNTVLCGYDDGKMQITDLRKSTEVLSVMDAHQGPIWSIDCSRGNGNLITTGGEDGFVKLWSLPEKKWAKCFKTRSCKVLSTFWTMSNFLITAGVPDKQR